MGRNRDSRDPSERSVDPRSARQEIAEGAREIAVDDWIDAQLRERPKTVSGMKAVGQFRETARGMGSPVAGSPIASESPPEPPVGAPDTQREPPKWSASTVAFVALKDERISQLEEQLAKATADLMSREAAPMAAPRPAPLRTIPMQALAAPSLPAYPAPPAPRAQGATLFMPAPTAPIAPMPAAPAAPRGQGATLFMPATDMPSQSTYAAPMPPAASSAIALPLSEDDGGGRTMMLAPDAAMPFGATVPSELEPLGPIGSPNPAPSVQSVAPLGPAPPVHSMPLGLAPSYLSPHPEPTAKNFDVGELVLAPKRPRKGGWLVGIALLAIALAGGAYAYRVGLGPFAELRARELSKSEARATKATAALPDAETPVATTTGANAPPSTASATAAATSTTPESATPSATGTSPPPPVTPDDPNELGALLSFQGYLTVTSPGDAEVVVQGQPAGRTNARLLVRCGPRNVRLRSDDLKWLSEGQHVQIECMQHTHVTIAATP